MKITAIPQLYRNLQRWREILAVLRRYGLADWLSHFRLPFRDAFKDRGGVPLSNYSREQRVRMALTDLGPTFIKLGQILAARPDLVGPPLAEELKRLRVNVPPDDIALVRKMLCKELGDDYEKHFLSIDPVPLATASIGQVHRAQLNDGTRVVIKVQRTNIERIMMQDMDVLMGLAQLAEKVEQLAAWGPVDMMRQIGPMIKRELDFSRERQNLELFAEIFRRRSSDVVIPCPTESLCTRRVLVMEELIGQPLEAFLRDEKTGVQPVGDPSANGSAAKQLKTQSKPNPEASTSLAEASSTRSAGGENDREGSSRAAIKSRLCETIAGIYLTMIFDEAIFHADPHTGNLIVMRDGRLGILDFGMIG